MKNYFLFFCDRLKISYTNKSPKPVGAVVKPTSSVQTFDAKRSHATAIM